MDNSKYLKDKNLQQKIDLFKFRNLLRKLGHILDSLLGV